MSFLVLKPEYPHGSASNALFTVKKGEILECPAGYEPSDSFQVCETHEAAVQYIILIGKAIASQQATKAEESPKDKMSAHATYPLFRKVASIGDDEPTFQLFSRDIHRFLSRDEAEITADIQVVNLHHNTAERLLEYERKNFTRKAVTTVLEGIVNKTENPSEEKEGSLSP